MRFLWITKENPLPADSGARIYSNGLLRALLQTGATGSLVAYDVPEARLESIKGLTMRLSGARRRRRVFSLLSSLHSDAFSLKTADFSRRLATALEEQPDAVIIDYFALGWVLPEVKAAMARMSRRPVLVYVSHNYEPRLRQEVAAAAETPLMRAIMKYDAAKGARIDAALTGNVDLIVANTDDDKAAYQKDAPGKRIITLTPAYDGEIAPTRPITADLPRRVIITGAFDWIAKQIALRRFLKSAEKPFQSAEIELRIVGRADPAFMQELSAEYPFASFTGRVADVRPYLADGRIGVMPDDVGGGFKHKYLYYIFAGLPVATIASQFQGMPLDLERDVIARPTIPALVQAIVSAIDEIPMLDGMRQRCWEACAGAFNWRDRGVALRQAIENIQAAR